MKTTNLLLITGLAMVAYKAYSSGKTTLSEYENALDDLEAKIHKIKDFSISKGKVNIIADITIVNNSNQKFWIKSGDKIILEKIEIANKKGSVFATISPNLSSINLPAHGSMRIENVPIQANLTDFPGLILTGFEMFSSESIMNAINLNMVFSLFGKKIRV